jgi:homotetrameric cytidine deaminase
MFLNYQGLTEQDRNLIRRAEDLIQKRKSRRSGVAAALITSNGKIFQGVNIEIEASAPCSICAEYAAIGTMVTEGEKTVNAIVAVNYKGKVIPPCGKCRQFISEFGNPYVVVEVGSDLKKSRLTDLYPLPVSSE